MSAATDRQAKETSPVPAAAGSRSETGVIAATAAALAFIAGSAVFAMKRTRRGTAARRD
ncbi:hypothetical protein [Streptomyces sp. NPDC046685]|uniref:hypothetical protein n=1 Tax=Streptomyces sp. NPDC046685 TaxID=3157202 RepID=UPI0033FAB56E